ncbi:hypothetical protein E2542_SST27597 [Spatholobus suberectus]|nr:hypothetical protein E2542_SST27597 [Spatholobus suberectus]
MCKRCGNLRRLACSRCKGTGLIREGGILSIKLVEDLYETLGNSESKVFNVFIVLEHKYLHIICLGTEKLPLYLLGKPKISGVEMERYSQLVLSPPRYEITSNHFLFQGIWGLILPGIWCPRSAHSNSRFAFRGTRPKQVTGGKSNGSVFPHSPSDTCTRKVQGFPSIDLASPGTVYCGQ